MSFVEVVIIIAQWFPYWSVELLDYSLLSYLRSILSLGSFSIEPRDGAGLCKGGRPRREPRESVVSSSTYGSESVESVR